MNPTTDCTSTLFPIASETGPNTTSRVNKHPSDVVDIGVPLQSTEQYAPYKKISLVASGTRLCCIILANCSLSALICVCLWSFAKVDNLTRWERRVFNTLVLLLSAALGFGIGFLFNQVGLLARGKVLEGGSYSKEGVCTNPSVVDELTIPCILVYVYL